MPAIAFDKICNKLTGFNVNYGYGLDYNWNYIPTVDMEHYSAVEFDFSNEQHFIIASKMLNQKDNGDWMMPNNIRRTIDLYQQYSVFEPDLWFFARDNFENKLVGITISYFDSEISETQIDYFYVLPQFHKRGTGRFLLNETVNRSKKRSKYILTGGTNEFYKKCGFGESRHTVWAAKERFQFIASCVQP